MSQGWSDNLKETTRNVLDNLPVDSFCGDKTACHMKHRDGRYGHITLQSALQNCYSIHLDGSNEEAVEPYESIEDLIAAGWAVD